MHDLTPDDRRRVATLQRELGKPETLKRLFAALAPQLDRDRRTLVYILAQADRIGHAAMEPLFLNSLHGSEYERIVVLCGPMERPGANPWIRHLAGPAFRFVETEDEMLPLMGFLDGGLATIGPVDLLLASPQKLIRDFGHHVRAGGAIRHFALADTIADRGRAWFGSKGIDLSEPTVLLHVRDKGFRADLSHHDFRCADVGTYRAAIDRLVSSGYRVLRLGDQSSPPLDHPSDRVVDLPHSDDHDPALDLYVAAHCAFALNQASGPEALVRAFGRPALTVNMTWEQLRLPLAEDQLLFKPYLDAASGRPLRYAEILDRDLPVLGRGEDLLAKGVAVGENTADQLLAAVDDWLAARPADAVAQARFRALGRAYEARVATDAARRRDHLDFYAHAGPNGRLAVAMLAAQPDFLD